MTAEAGLLAKLAWPLAALNLSLSPLLVAADLEWLPGAKIHDAAVEGVCKLADAGADDIRLLNFNIFPGILISSRASRAQSSR